MIFVELQPGVWVNAASVTHVIERHFTDAGTYTDVHGVGGIMVTVHGPAQPVLEKLVTAPGIA